MGHIGLCDKQRIFILRLRMADLSRHLQRESLEGMMHKASHEIPNYLGGRVSRLRAGRRFLSFRVIVSLPFFPVLSFFLCAK